MQHEVWRPPRRRLRLALTACQAVFFGALTVSWLSTGHPVMALVSLMATLAPAFLALDAGRRRVETGGQGIKVVSPFRSVHLDWAQIAEVRPDAHGPWATRLVVVTRDGDVVDLQVPPDSGVTDRWRQAAATGSDGPTRG